MVATFILAGTIILLGYLGTADNDTTLTYILVATIAAGVAGAVTVYGSTAGFICARDMQ
ncbi:MAG: hypothetical protein MJ219_04530 [Mycoplasmoidaceae bacterium]|nr:hypothetical protein [Mycoplasmoidaceae bacterium]